jgi:hypothetical protein
MLDVSIVYDNPNDYKRFLDNIESNICYILGYNINSHVDRSKAIKIKTKWGAIKNPFIEISEMDKPLKCFYSDESYEYGNDIINQAIKFINGKSKIIK